MKFKNRQHKLFLGTAKSLQLCPTLWDPPGSSVHGILRAKTLDWVAMPSSRGSSRPRDRTHICFLYWQAGSLPWSHQGIHGTKIKRMISESHSVVSDSCDPMDCSPQGSSVYGILQARILEWVAISFFRESSRSRNRTHVFCIAGRFFTD